MLPHLQYQNLQVSRRQPHLNFVPSASLSSRPDATTPKGRDNNRRLNYNPRRSIRALKRGQLDLIGRRIAIELFS